jgi:hemerythrin-like domain-containing protein
MEIYQLIQREHDHIRKILNEIEDTNNTATTKRDELLQALRVKLLSHTRAEETVFYDRLKKELKMIDLMIRSEEEHTVIDNFLNDLEEIPTRAPQWAARFLIFRELLDWHLQREENQIIPLAKKILSDKEALQLGLRMSRDERDIRANLAS